MDKGRVLYEDNHLIVVNKGVGELVQGDKTGEQPLLESVRAFLKERDGKKGNVFLGLTHRLDCPTSGTVLFAKTSKALSRLNALFRERRVYKAYWTVLQTPPAEPQGRWVDYLIRNHKKNRSFVCSSGEGKAKQGILSYRLIGSVRNYYLVEVELETGRHHQIRCQFAHRGCFIKGDLKYGAKRSNPNGGIHLHARRLRFKHPVREEEILVQAPVPREDDLWLALEKEFG